MTKTEAYHVFGLSLNQPVTIDLIKNRYRILTKTYHPDNPRTGNEEMMAKVNLAFNALRTYNFDPEEKDTIRQPGRGKGFAEDFNPDFTPFEYGSKDESFYQNIHYRNRQQTDRYSQNASNYNRNNAPSGGRADSRQYENYENAYDEQTVTDDKKQKKRGGIFILFRMIGRLCKLIILLGILGFFVLIPASIYFFGMNQRGMMLAGAALIMSVLSIFVYRFFSELIR